jgi:hypothetical protein
MSDEVLLQSARLDTGLEFSVFGSGEGRLRIRLDLSTEAPVRLTGYHGGNNG